MLIEALKAMGFKLDSDTRVYEHRFSIFDHYPISSGNWTECTRFGDPPVARYIDPYTKRLCVIRLMIKAPFRSLLIYEPVYQEPGFWLLRCIPRDYGMVELLYRPL